MCTKFTLKRISEDRNVVWQGMRACQKKMEDMLEPFGGWRYKRAVEGNGGGIAA